MSRKNWKNVDARFAEDRKDVLEYAGPDVSFALRSGLRDIDSMSQRDEERAMQRRIIRRAKKRKASHHGEDVPLRFETKPRAHRHGRETIRRPAYLDFLAEKEAEGIIYNI